MYKNLTQQKLNAIKKNIVCIIFDYDGTLQSSLEKKYDHKTALYLIREIIEKGKIPVIITARGATALQIFEKSILALSSLDKTIPIFLGLGNGTALYRFSQGKKETVYNYGLKSSEIRQIISVWKKVYKDFGFRDFDLHPQGLETFRQFLKENWVSYIPTNIFNICKKYNGRCFTENAKVTIVLPKDTQKHSLILSTIEKELNKKFAAHKKKYQVRRGDLIYAHITHTFDIDPKLYALQSVMEKLKLSKNQVAVFGDMPQDNDKGFLVDSGLPYAFTNDPTFTKKDIGTSPYILSNSKTSPVEAVYKAITFLLG